MATTNKLVKSSEIANYSTAKDFYQQFSELMDKRLEEDMDIAEDPFFKEDEISTEFKEFYLRYGNNPDTLYNINLQIPKNKVTAIIGPSGCGKSTLLRAINRMNEEITEVHSRGSIEVDGEDIYAPDADTLALRTKVGMVFQKPQPFPRTIYENITFGPKLHGINNQEQLYEIVNSSLKQVGMYDEVGHRLDDHAYGLSGGQQQRLCIARAIAVNPSVILADEPASALDPKSTYQIEELLLEFKKKYTVVIVTHNMQQAARISDYTFFMFNGVVVEYGKTSQIFENPFYDLTERYISGRFG